MPTGVYKERERGASGVVEKPGAVIIKEEVDPLAEVLSSFVRYYKVLPRSRDIKLALESLEIIIEYLS